MDCGELGAWPLRRTDGVLSSAAVDRDEWARRTDRAGVDAWLGEGGRLRPLRFADARRGDPSEWLDAETLLIEPFDLTQPVAEARLSSRRAICASSHGSGGAFRWSWFIKFLAGHLGIANPGADERARPREWVRWRQLARTAGHPRAGHHVRADGGPRRGSDVGSPGGSGAQSVPKNAPTGASGGGVVTL
ncbi:hypothetical protein Ddc_23896 [Ditylenchus destructor]|nr:hypothetical protein Ddc_23896 [Ditylenchus destructor]